MTLIFRYETHFDDVYAGTILLRTPEKEKPLCRFYINRECAPPPGISPIAFGSCDTLSLCLFLRYKRERIYIKPLIRGDWYQELAWMQMRIQKLDNTNVADKDYTALMQKLYLRALDDGQNPRSMQCEIENAETLYEVHDPLFNIEEDLLDNDDEDDDDDYWDL